MTTVRPLIGSAAAMRMEPRTTPPDDMPEEHVAEWDLDDGEWCECMACAAPLFTGFGIDE